MDFVSWKDRKPVPSTVEGGLATALKEVYRAPSAEAAEQALTAFEAGPWGTRYPAIGHSWRRAWAEVTPFFAFPDEVRRIIYTINAIEALNSKLRRAVRARGHFPSDEAATKALLSNCVQAVRYWVLFLSMALRVMRSFRMVATIASLKGLPASRSRLVVAARCPLPERAMASAAR